jgi:thioredoxin 1
MKMMPVLDELEKEYQGRLEVQFIDVFKYPKVAEEYGVQSIPVQIFYGASGKELYRHEGFIAKEDILKKWQELGVGLCGAFRGTIDTE